MWQDLDQHPKDNEAGVKQQRELAAALAAALVAGGPIVTQWLGRIATAGSYHPGRSADETAYHEGKRQLAQFIINAGGENHG